MNPTPEYRKALKVHGRVQMVGFRWWTLHEAQRLGLRGYVRNCSDGSVEVAIAGAEADVEEMVRRLHSGPPGARVDRIEELEPPASYPDGFEIR